MKVTTVITDGILSKVSFETESISENIFDAVNQFLYENEMKNEIKTDTDTKATPKVETPIKKNKVAKKEATASVKQISGSFKPPTYTASGTLSQKLMTDEEIENVEEVYAQPLQGVKPISPAEAFGTDEVETKKPEPIKAEKKASPPPPPPAPKTDNAMLLQAKDVVEQIKKNKGEDYLNRRGQLIVQSGVKPEPITEVEVIEEIIDTDDYNGDDETEEELEESCTLDPNLEPEDLVFEVDTLRERFDAVLVKAKSLGFKQASIDGIKWEQNNTEERVAGLEKIIKQKENK